MEDASANAPARPASSRSLLAILRKLTRFFVADRVGFVLLIWLTLAFIARPIFLSAHFGAAGEVQGWLRSHLSGLELARFAGSLQWASLFGLVLVLALVHVRLNLEAPQILADLRVRFAIGCAYALALCLAYIVFVWTPVTAVSLMMHDSFIFYDAIHRIDAGQRPSVDFPTALGAAMLYLPWAGAKISGGYAGAIEIASAIVALVLGLACAQASARRHSPGIAAVLIGAIFLIAVPAMLEGYNAPDSMTFEDGQFLQVDQKYAEAMFYNRWGWATLIAMFAFLTPRERGEATPVAEVATLGLMLAFLFWLKASYFIVGAAAALVYGFLGDRPWRTFGVGAGVALGAVAGIALLTQNLFAYLGDLMVAAKVSGARASNLGVLIKSNLLDILVALLPIALMALMKRLTRVDIWITAVIVLGTLFIINQNAQSSGLPTLIALSAYAVWRLREDDSRPLRLAAGLGLVVLAAVAFLDRGTGLLGQTTVARREEARGPTPWADIPALKNIYAQEREGAVGLIAAAKTETERVAAFRTMSMFGRRQFLRSGEYIASLRAGMDELKPVMRFGDSVVVMDFSSPLAFLMNARSARGYWLTFDDSRTIDEKTFPQPERLFADADHVMLPKLYVEPDTAALLKLLYSSWLDANYEEKSESAYWVRWSHHKAKPGPSLALRPMGRTDSNPASSNSPPAR